MRRFLIALVVASGCRASAGPRCVAQTFADRKWVVCTVDVRRERLQLFDLDEAGTPFGSFEHVAAALAKRGQALAWAMNAGMFDPGGRPVGLYVEGGRQLKSASTKDGPGNFHMKPNGIFLVEDGRASVAETEAYLQKAHRPELATQSGPMLVIGGAVHPRILQSGTSRKRRNGVGARDDHTAVFVSSEEPVTFWEMATFFRDALHCNDALFLDGTVSSLYAPELARHDDAFPLGPIVGIVR